MENYLKGKEANIGGTPLDTFSTSMIVGGRVLSMIYLIIEIGGAKELGMSKMGPRTPT